MGTFRTVIVGVCKPDRDVEFTIFKLPREHLTTGLTLGQFLKDKQRSLNIRWNENCDCFYTVKRKKNGSRQVYYHCMDNPLASYQKDDAPIRFFLDADEEQNGDCEEEGCESYDEYEQTDDSSSSSDSESSDDEEVKSEPQIDSTPHENVITIM